MIQTYSNNLFETVYLFFSHMYETLIKLTAAIHVGEKKIMGTCGSQNRHISVG